MYLLTFITLLIGVIGIYTQVIALQAARFAAQQSGVGTAMLSWHAAAVSMADSLVHNGYTPVATGCIMESYTGVSAASLCPPPVGLTGKGVVTTGAAPNYIGTTPGYVLNGTANKVCVSLPGAQCTISAGNCTTACTADYNTTDYRFYTVLFQSSGQNYVMTYLPPGTVSATNPTGFMVSASGSMLNVTSGDLLQQLKNATQATQAFGPLSANGTSLVLLTTGGVSYTLAASPSGPASLIGLATAGGVAIISAP